jgi:type IV pilus assembly protein PilN
VYSLVVEINLLPTQYRKRSEPGVWRLATLALPIAAALGVVIFTGVQAARLSNLNAELEANKGEISALEPKKREYDDLTRQKTDLQKVTEVSKTLQASKTYWSSDLARFVAALPSDGNVALSALTMRAIDSNSQTNLTTQGLYNGKAVSKEFDLTGLAKTSGALVTFLKTFENNPNFGVNFKSAQKAQAATPGTAQSSAQSSANAPYTFNATIGLVGQATAAAVSTPAGSSGTPGSAGQPSTGGSNVR